MFGFLKFGQGTDKGKKSLLALLLLGSALGICLLFLGNASTPATQSESQSVYDTASDELIIYQNYLEKRIQELCESVSGVGNVKVAVTLSGSFESVYATEWPDGNEEYVILGSGSSASALYLTRSAPEIAGIGIVCTGGSNDVVRHELISLLCATFSISSHRIYVTEGR